MSVPRITEILEEEIQARLDSQDEATREKATSDYLAFATLKELRKIRMILEDETGTEIPDEEIENEEIT
ncbi:acyl carrier protein [Patescibacteria group bacterium]|jgi:hypothetical protein|nr:acyl carrier protein [Patescibacteria group bacterium]